MSQKYNYVKYKTVYFSDYRILLLSKYRFAVGFPEAYSQPLVVSSFCKMGTKCPRYAQTLVMCVILRAQEKKKARTR